MKKFTILFLCIITFSLAQVNQKVSFFPLENIKLSNSIFSNATDTNKKYLLDMNADRLLAPYLKEAGLQPKAKIIPIGKIQDLTVILVDITFLLFH